MYQAAVGRFYLQHNDNLQNNLLILTLFLTVVANSSDMRHQA